MRTLLTGILLAFNFTIHAAATADSLSMVVNGEQKQFQVALPANPTTGYQWTVTTYDKSLLRLVSSKYTAGQTNRMGAGGKMLFTFALVQGKAYPKSTQLLFKYARSWEPKSGTMKTVTVNFK